MAKAKASKGKASSKGAKARPKAAKKGSRPKGKGRTKATPAKSRSSGPRRKPIRPQPKVHHSQLPLVIMATMVIVVIGGLLMISESPNDKNLILAVMVGTIMVGIFFLYTSTSSTAQGPSSRRTGVRRPSSAGRRRKTELHEIEKPAKPSGPTISASVSQNDQGLAPAASPSPLPLSVPMATLAPVAPLPTVPPPNPLPGSVGAPGLPTPARPPLQVRTPIHPRSKVSYPVNLGGGDYANTHILVDKDTILQLRTPLVPDFEPVPPPDYLLVAATIPKKPQEVSAAPAPPTPPVGPVPTLPASPGVAVPAAPPAPPQPVAPQPVGAQPPPQAAVPMAGTPVQAAPAVPVAVTATPGVPVAQAAPPAAAAPVEDETAIDFDEEMEWD